ncbi:hypothetical protein J2S53_001750 [Actinopolyspora lacussalsi]|nr:hypothetical protein [Actinopolyspora lacussalsi]
MRPAPEIVAAGDDSEIGDRSENFAPYGGR